DRIVVIDGGVVIAEGAPTELKRRVGNDRLELTFDDQSFDQAVAALGADVIDSDPDAFSAVVAVDDTNQDVKRALDMLAEAGIIVQTVAFGSTTTATAVAGDLQKGIMDRFRSLPMSSLAVLNGHVVSDVLRNTISTVVMLIAGLAIGFRSSASIVDWLLIAA